MIENGWNIHKQTEHYAPHQNQRRSNKSTHYDEDPTLQLAGNDVFVCYMVG